MAKDVFRGPLEQVDECCWRVPKSYRPGMRVDGLVFADERLMAQIRQDQALDQVANVAFCRASSTPAWRCPTSTGATASASAASAPPTPTRAASFPPAGSAMTSIA